MFGCRRGTAVASNKIKDGGNAFDDAMFVGKGAAFGERNPCALIFAIATLDFLVNTLLDFSF